MLLFLLFVNSKKLKTIPAIIKLSLTDEDSRIIETKFNLEFIKIKENWEFRSSRFRIFQISKQFKRTALVNIPK